MPLLRTCGDEWITDYVRVIWVQLAILSESILYLLTVELQDNDTVVGTMFHVVSMRTGVNAINLGLVGLILFCLLQLLHLSFTEQPLRNVNAVLLFLLDSYVAEQRHEFKVLQRVELFVENLLFRLLWDCYERQIIKYSPLFRFCNRLIHISLV